MLQLVPIQLLRRKAQAVFRENPDARPQFPKTLLVEVICRITLYVSIHMKLLIKLFKKKSLVENPARRIAVLVYLPPLGDNTVFYDAGIGNERINPVGCHYGHGVARLNGGGGVLNSFLTRTKAYGNA